MHGDYLLVGLNFECLFCIQKLNGMIKSQRKFMQRKSERTIRIHLQIITIKLQNVIGLIKLSQKMYIILIKPMTNHYLKFCFQLMRDSINSN